MCFVCLGIDDEPEDGPQHYILMLGFYQPHLIAALDAIGVHVANVIKLWSEHLLANELVRNSTPPTSDYLSPVEGTAAKHGSNTMAAI